MLTATAINKATKRKTYFRQKILSKLFEPFVCKSIQTDF